MAIRGYNPTAFKDSLYEAAALYDPEWKEKIDVPALLVTNISPALALSDADKLKEAKFIVFPLENIYQETGTITKFLSDLLDALKSDESLESLDDLDPSRFGRLWGWLNRYVQIAPSFFGFKININKILGDIVKA